MSIVPPGPLTISVPLASRAWPAVPTGAGGALLASAAPTFKLPESVNLPPEIVIDSMAAVEVAKNTLVASIVPPLMLTLPIPSRPATKFRKTLTSAIPLML